MKLDLSRQERRLAEIAAEAETIGTRFSELDDAAAAEVEVDGETRTAGLTEEQSTEYRDLADRAAALETEAEQLRDDIKARKRVAALAATKVEGPSAPEFKKDPGDPYEDRGLFGPKPGELRARAVTAVEDVDGWEMEDRDREHAVRLIERHDDRNGTIARMVLTTGSKEYKEAWARAITLGPAWLNERERTLMLRAMEARAMTQTDAAGGFAIPFPIDPQLIITGDGSTNPFRAIGNVQPITTDSWQGLSAGAVSASFDSEAAEVSDDTPTWAQPQVVAHMARAFIPASIEITQDYPNLANDLVMLFREGKNDLETTVFSTGSGSGQPFGIVTAIDGTGNDVSSATTDVYAVADVRTTFETVGAKYRSRSSWVANVGIINDTVAFGTDALATQTLSLADSPVGLSVLGRPVFESSAMDGTVNATQENNILVFGDFQHFLIADRVGGAVGALEFIPHMFATANNLPSGQRGWFYYWRVGSDSVNDDAFALLNAT